MKRLSNKKRKLIYIRQKNKLRLGGKLLMFLKVSNEMLEDTQFITDNLDYMHKDSERKYKMPLSVVILMGTCEGDFIHNMKTIRLTFTKL